MKTNKLLSRIVLFSMLSITAVVSAVMVSCSSTHSVRDIRASRDPDADYGSRPINIKVAQTKDDALVKALFMQTKRPNIELPYQEGESNVAIASEQVTYTHAESIGNQQTTQEGKPNLNEVQHLSEVVVTAKSRFTPEQDGRVNVDFVMKVPKELLSENFRVTLAPRILHNDSVVPLKEVLLKGIKFSNKQKQDYLDFAAYEKTIVDPKDYDSVFVNHRAVQEDIEQHQNFYYGRFHKEWSRQTDYEQWKAKKDEAEAVETARQIGLNKKRYHEQTRKVRQQIMKDVAKGKDTTGLFVKYMKKALKEEDLEKGKMQVERRNDYRVDFYKEYSIKVKQQAAREHAKGKDTTGYYARRMKLFDKNMKNMVLDGEDLEKVPERFRDIYRSGRNLDKIQNFVMTAEDSAMIAQDHYLYEEIALNELKAERLDETRKEMIPFPNETGMRLDTIIETNKEFIYYYKQDYPVSPGLKQLRLVMDSRIDAIDKSFFIPIGSDTLAYFISSLSQLADTSLITKRTTLHRDVYNSMVIYPKFQKGRTNFVVNNQDNKEQTDKIIDAFETFKDKGGFLVDSVVIKVTTSLDGTWEKNEELSVKRAEALRSHFSRMLGVNPDVFKTRVSGEDWNTLAKLVVRRPDLVNKDEILDILTNAVYPDQTEDDIRKAYPQDFRIIRDSIYPMLNKAEVTFNMTRPGMNAEIEESAEYRPEYAQAIQYLQDREYWKALEILSNYPDFNTALCLVCMGYNNKALEVLDMLDETGNTEYLRTILAIRAKDENKAIAHLLKACELDPSKAYRAPLDPEVAALVRKHNLQEQLNSVASVSDLPVEEETQTEEPTETTAAE
ncbi:MAG: hypothetical protein E6767_12180 [Dysgonomonas sp.]|nr:hypothetical protein [Dysgonomonas sp.]